MDENPTTKTIPQPIQFSWHIFLVGRKSQRANEGGVLFKFYTCFYKQKHESDILLPTSTKFHRYEIQF